MTTTTRRNHHEALESCSLSARICQETIHHELAAGGKHASMPHIRLLMDCADLCETTARFLMRESDALPLIAEACAELCTRCADDCRSLGGADMGRCAVLLDRCADLCRGLVPKREVPVDIADTRRGPAASPPSIH